MKQEFETVITCPLGSVCQRIVDGHVERCAWFTKVEGMNPQTGEQVSEEKCAIAWLPILNVESSMQSRNVAASVQSLRNETIKRQDAALQEIRHPKEEINVKEIGR